MYQLWGDPERVLADMTPCQQASGANPERARPGHGPSAASPPLGARAGPLVIQAGGNQSCLARV
jgi:hypothetical protein